MIITFFIYAILVNAYDFGSILTMNFEMHKAIEFYYIDAQFKQLHTLLNHIFICLQKRSTIKISRFSI